ncbi:hypothetical protein DPMN_011977 [Dreissena polymorpha]|uniref:Uncharacterized protein n=1 Tax=Dreissena polymorpha TaxID=45954 RepID=A0A9D4S2B7_DREPO|nr:hypothetical protein DPMN_011977 [Dreissena polymorpha]
MAPDTKVTDRPLSNFEQECLKNVNARVFATQMWTDDGQIPILKPHLSNQVCKSIFQLVRDINKTTVLTKFHNDKAKIVTSRVFTRFLYRKCATPAPGNHETKILTKFHKNWTKNLTSRVFTCFHYINIEKTAPPTGSHVFSQIWTIFELVRDINKTNVLPKKTAPSPGSHVFQRTRTIFELNSHWTKNVTSRETAPSSGGHVFSPIWTNFELVRDINKTNVLTKFHDDWAKNCD